ncbi:hypothetical protein D8B23_00350 [Verminephrobacter aporrectodeae subsp. tuberculatae]|nr:hypothetical protein [Verminephrobacter aporrectodeae subsp. tuberculatae]
MGVSVRHAEGPSLGACVSKDKCSPDTALRDINDLLARGVLRKSGAGGRSTGYELNGEEPPWSGPFPDTEGNY